MRRVNKELKEGGGGRGVGNQRGRGKALHCIINYTYTQKIDGQMVVLIAHIQVTHVFLEQRILNLPYPSDPPQKNQMTMFHFQMLLLQLF